MRAVGSQSTIIGPTHAISAALTSLKGAARRVRKASSSSSARRDSRLDGNLNGSGGDDFRVAASAATAAAAAAGISMTATAEEDVVNADGDKNGNEEDHSDFGDREEQVGGPRGKRGGGGGRGGEAGEAAGSRAAADAAAAAAAAAVGEWTGSVFGEEAQQYGVMLEAMIRGAVEVRASGGSDVSAHLLPCVRSCSIFELRVYARGIGSGWRRWLFPTWLVISSLVHYCTLLYCTQKEDGQCVLLSAANKDVFRVFFELYSLRVLKI